ncbi:hypothetical protein [Pannonibacter tanglangensis]|nr:MULTISPECIES: hypothetical protein [unclassified Pannonibacter]
MSEFPEPATRDFIARRSIRVLPFVLIWVAAPMPLWLMLLLQLFY